MANPEHLAILKQGVEEWNKWRENILTLVPHLSGATSTRRNSVANLSGADLIEADLSRRELFDDDLGGEPAGRTGRRQPSQGGSLAGRI